MEEARLVIQDRNPELFEKLKEEFSGRYLIEIARRGNGNQLYYVIGDENTERLLWQIDNHLNYGGGNL